LAGAGAEYSTKGVPDFAGTGEVFHSPAAGRLLQVAVTMGR
jgi:hypothetical protein